MVGRGRKVFQCDVANRVFLGFLACMFASFPGPIAFAQAAGDDKATLRAVSLLFRHGAISPKYNLPKAKVDWPMGFMQLTEIGRRGMYERGQKLRAKYVDQLGFISPTYQQNEIYVRASGTDRALQSAQVLVFGLYPSASSEIVFANATGGGKPATTVPVHTVPLTVDNLMRPWTGKANCRKYVRYVESFPKSRLYQAMAEKHKPFLRRVSAATGVNEGKPPARILYEVNEIYEPISSIVVHGKPLPAGISAEDIKQLSALSDWNYHHQFLGKRVGRLTGGVFVEQVLNNFDRTVKLGDTPRFYLYSGHQRTILGVDAALGIETAHTEGDLYEGRIVPLGSHYAFELHEMSPKTYAVKVKFVTDAAEQTLRIPGCAADICPLENFRKAVSGAIADDWARECSGG